MAEVQNMNWVHTGGVYTSIENTNFIKANTVFNQFSPVSDMQQDKNIQYYQEPGNSIIPSTRTKRSSIQNFRKKAFVRMIEQPASKALRFRYECEGRLAGSLPGVNSTNDKKTFPTIEIVGYKGRAIVVVSCVTKDPPYKPHPHNLVGKDGCKKGVCTMEINTETMRATFCNLGIQCVKRKDIEQSLRLREEIRVDPFLTGFLHKTQPSSIDLNSVRLCFQVFLENDKGQFTIPLAPVISDPIYDKKAIVDLLICTLCSCTSTVSGGKEIILLCEKVIREDIAIRFYEEKDGQILWEDYGDFRHSDVHKQVAIKFRTPAYKNLEIDQPVKVFIQLKRPSDGVTSEPIPFEYLPIESDISILKRKRADQMRHKYENINEQQNQNIGMQQYQNFVNMTNVSTVMTGSVNYATATTTNTTTNANLNYHHHHQQQQQKQQEYINYNHLQQQQHWTPDYKPQIPVSSAMSVNNFNIDNLLTGSAQQTPIEWNILTPGTTNCKSLHEGNNNNLTVQQLRNSNCPQGNKNQNGTCSLDVMDSDLLMELNSAELERLTLS